MATQLVLHVFDDVGVSVVAYKTEGSSTCITFLSTVIDTVSSQLWLPEEMVGRLVSMLQLRMLYKLQLWPLAETTLCCFVMYFSA